MTSAARTTDDAFQDVLLGLFQLHGRVLEAADVMSGGFGLTGARWQVMKVAGRQSLTVSQIARRLGLQRQSVQRTWTSSPGRGWWSCAPTSITSAPGWWRCPTTAGAFSRRSSPASRRGSGRVLRGLARAELERLAESLGALAQRVDAATDREHSAGAPRSTRAGRPATGVRRRLVAA